MELLFQIGEAYCLIYKLHIIEPFKAQQLHEHDTTSALSRIQLSSFSGNKNAFSEWWSNFDAY